MVRILVLIALLLFTAVQADIVIPLGTENVLSPIFLTPWAATSTSDLSQNHLDELLATLRFDLKLNGTTSVVDANSARTQLALQEGTRAFDADKGKSLGVLYVVRAVVDQRRLHVRVDSVTQGAGKASYAAELVGRLTADRKQVHRLADAIHEDLFGKKGIASTQILYTVKRKGSGREEWESPVWIADYDGGNARPLTPGDSYCVTPAFCPHSKEQFFYVSYRQGQPKIFVGSTKGGSARRLTDLRGNQLMPAASAGGDQIAFICDAGGNPDLFVQKLDHDHVVGKPWQIFSAPAAAQGSPTFSPDGRQLAFVSNKDGAPRIYCLDVPKDGERANAKTSRLISRKCKENTAPAWSPDGRYIAYSSMTGDTRQIWVYDTTTDSEWQLTSGPGHKENPSWAPNSLHLIYNSSTKTESELYITHLRLKEGVKIGAGLGEKRFPCWCPTCFSSESYDKS